MSRDFDFSNSEDLRLLLVRLAYSGPRAWHDDPDATALLMFSVDKYAALARKHGFEPEDAAVAAFDVLRTRAARVARDPWAVVTRAVQLSLIYEARAQGLLCSNHRARRAEIAWVHDAVRFSDYEIDLADFHPAFHVQDDIRSIEEDVSEVVDEAEPTNAFVAVEAAAGIFMDLGWPEHVAAILLEYITVRLINTGSKSSAFESLRRDRQARLLLDLDQTSWLVVLRVVLGHQDPDLQKTAAGRGLLMRLLIGEQVEEIFADDAIADAIEGAVPAAGGSHV